MPHVTREYVVIFALLFLLLLLAVPPFLCMELHSDAILFDIYARNLQKGGVAYRDWCETNLPGMAWLHWGVRSVVGWRSEIMRAVDLGVVGAIVLLLARWQPGLPFTWRFALAFALLVFYLGSSEWCHVQRDPWMLLPALAALHLRRRWVVRPSFPRSVAEGLLWAAAFWIKPFVAVPALLVWVVSARQARKDCQASVRSIILDGFAVLAGGLLVGAAGIAWMVASGAWQYFVAMATDWNREYFAYDVTGGEPGKMALGVVSRSFPWILIHFAAVPIAVRDLRRGTDGSAVLLAALYLGWLAQGFFLQHLFDYVQMPAILIGFAVVFGRTAPLESPLPQRLFAAFLIVCISFRASVLLRDGLKAWPKCWMEGSSPAVRDQTSRFPVVMRVNWQDLQGATEFLKRNDVKDGELTCFNMPPSALYRELDVEAATRYHFFQNNWLAFRRHRPQIYADLTASRQRFVVVDVLWKDGVALKEPDLNLLPPRWERWKPRIVCQSGRYIVLEMTGAETQTWLEECFG